MEEEDLVGRRATLRHHKRESDREADMLSEGDGNRQHDMQSKDSQPHMHINVGESSPYACSHREFNGMPSNAALKASPLPVTYVLGRVNHDLSV